MHMRSICMHFAGSCPSCAQRASSPLHDTRKTFTSRAQVLEALLRHTNFPNGRMAPAPKVLPTMAKLSEQLAQKFGGESGWCKCERVAKEREEKGHLIDADKEPWLIEWVEGAGLLQPFDPPWLLAGGWSQAAASQPRLASRRCQNTRPLHGWMGKPSTAQNSEARELLRHLPFATLGSPFRMVHRPVA